MLYWQRKEVISVNSSPLNEKECFLVIHSLDELYAFLRKSGSRDRSLSRSAISQNLSAILSAKTKLRALPANASADFSAQELKVLYWAVYEMRDAIHSQLIEMPLASPVRGKAQESQQACDRLLRLFSDLLAEVCIEIESLFQDP